MSKTAHSTNISDSFCQKSHGASESRTWRFCPGAFPLTKGLETPDRAYRLHAIVRKIVVYACAPEKMLSLRASARTGVAIPRLESKCIDNCPTDRENAAIFGGNRYLVPFNRGIATSLRSSQ